MHAYTEMMTVILINGAERANRKKWILRQYDV